MQCFLRAEAGVESCFCSCMPLKSIAPDLEIIHQGRCDPQLGPCSRSNNCYQTLHPMLISCLHMQLKPTHGGSGRVGNILIFFGPKAASVLQASKASTRRRCSTSSPPSHSEFYRMSRFVLTLFDACSSAILPVNHAASGTQRQPT